MQVLLGAQGKAVSFDAASMQLMQVAAKVVQGHRAGAARLGYHVMYIPSLAGQPTHV